MFLETENIAPEQIRWHWQGKQNETSQNAVLQIFYVDLKDRKNPANIYTAIIYTFMWHVSIFGTKKNTAWSNKFNIEVAIPSNN